MDIPRGRSRLECDVVQLVTENASRRWLRVFCAALEIKQNSANSEDTSILNFLGPRIVSSNYFDLLLASRIKMIA